MSGHPGTALISTVDYIQITADYKCIFIVGVFPVHCIVNSK